ncbi:MAG: bifunctional shikimate kinase/3-dehydroquinate synthase, partial [Anaerolineales bacterium]
MRHIFLYGPPGVGKSTLGRLLAERLARPFIDLDAEIEAASGQPIADVMKAHGEPFFRDLESAQLRAVVERAPSVIALGGGALLRPENRALAESSGRVILLWADETTLRERLASQPHIRPLLAEDLSGKLSDLLAHRKAHYESFEFRVANISQQPEETLEKIQQKTGTYHIVNGGAAHDILPLPGDFSRLADALQWAGLRPPLALVTDSNIAPRYAEFILVQLQSAGWGSAEAFHQIILPPGEEQKNAATLQGLWRQFLEAGLDRKSTVLALGGGVIGDLTGFAAATFMRGVPWVNIPTSLLAMVDASLGGKTGIDLPEGKNLAGAFYPPRLVLVNPSVLKTLPVAEFRSGLAEVVKHGVIGDPELFALCAQGWDAVQSHLDDVIQRAMAVKIRIVEADPYERGVRAALNLGHTVGHAVEAVSNFTIRHGEAVAIGMAAEA